MKSYTDEEFNTLMEAHEYQKVIAAIIGLALHQSSGHVVAMMSKARLLHIKRAIDSLLPISIEVEGE